MVMKHRDIETHFLDSSDTGRPFLLVHGFTGSSLDFVDEFETLGSKRRTILVDQRGHGETTNSGQLEHYQLATLVDDLISFVESLSLSAQERPIDILGHSLGGMVVMRAVLARPDLFRSLILMDTAAEGLGTGPDLPQQLQDAMHEKGVQVLADVMQQTAPTPEVQRGIDQIGEIEHRRRISLKLSQMDPQAFFGLRRELGEQVSVLKDLSAITCPTTIIVGSADKPFRTASDKMAAAISQSRLIVINDAAHSPQYENRDSWRAAIESHFENL